MKTLMQGEVDLENAFSWKPCRLGEFLTHEAAMNDRPICAPDEAALPESAFQVRPLKPGPLGRRTDAMVFEHQARFFAGQERQIRKQLVAVGKIENNKIRA